ncbi:hypothetical protein BSNT_07286 [Bacillus subtilis subsp. natto BEST195]|nr:hypothetical protein BSNT_07286 [Bacillus subtilis subsp. natto BEST195]
MLHLHFFRKTESVEAEEYSVQSGKHFLDHMSF